jgi:hypothetical protein
MMLRNFWSMVLQKVASAGQIFLAPLSSGPIFVGHGFSCVLFPLRPIHAAPGLPLRPIPVATYFRRAQSPFAFDFRRDLFPPRPVLTALPSALKSSQGEGARLDATKGSWAMFGSMLFSAGKKSVRSGLK